MANLRAALTAALVAGLPDAKVIGFPGTLVRVEKPTVAVWANTLTHLDAAPNGHFSVQYTVALYTQHQDPSRADDALDELLSQAITVLWAVQKNFVLVSAERQVGQDNTIHSWALTVSGGITIEED